MSYRRGHVTTKIHRIRQKKSILKKLWFWLMVFSALLVSSFFYFLFFYEGFWVKDIIIYGNNRVELKSLQDIISTEVRVSILKFWGLDVGTKNIFLVNIDKIKNNVLQTIPEIEEMAITKKFPKTLSIIIKERMPIGVFCGDTDQCFYIDNKGIIFESVDVPPKDITIVRQATGASNLFIGKEVVLRDIIDAISKIQKNLNDNFQITVKNVLITSAVRVNIITSENWKAYFDVGLLSDIGAQIKKLDVLLEGELKTGSRGELRYIDLRPNDRAIICDNSICEAQ